MYQIIIIIDYSYCSIYVNLITQRRNYANSHIQSNMQINKTKEYESIKIYTYTDERGFETDLGVESDGFPFSLAFFFREDDIDMLLLEEQLP